METLEDSDVDTCEVAASGIEMANNLRTGASKFCLARLGMGVLPEAILMSKARSLVAHITVLDLKHNALQLLPSELFLCLTQLQEMDASENQISYIPEAIGMVSHLRKLNLRGNRVKTLPEGICRLRSLEELRLAHNSVECLPKAIGGLQKLRVLDLANNVLEEVPNEAGELAALEQVDLGGNPVQRMPLFIQRLQTKGELLRSKAMRKELVARALHVRGAVRAAFVEDSMREAK